MSKAVDHDRGKGRVLFAATLFLVLGAFNLIEGLVALADPEKFKETDLFYGNLTLWGWLLLVLGALQLCASVLIFRRRLGGQALGIALCVFNLLFQLFVVSVYPLWGLLIMGLDVMIIYALCIYDEHFH